MWTSEGRASFGFSFWLVLLAALTFLGNILVIDHATRDQLTLAKVSTSHSCTIRHQFNPKLGLL